MSIQTVNVNFNYTDANGQNASRPFKIEQGMVFDFNGQSSYEVTSDGFVDTKTGEVKGFDISSTKEDVAALQGISQANSDSDIERGDKESVLTSRDVQDAKNPRKQYIIQNRVNDLEFRIGSFSTIHEYTGRGPGMKYNEKTGEFSVRLSDIDDKSKSQALTVSSEQSRAEGKQYESDQKKKADEWDKEHWFLKYFTSNPYRK